MAGQDVCWWIQFCQNKRDQMLHSLPWTSWGPLIDPVMTLTTHGSLHKIVSFMRAGTVSGSQKLSWCQENMENCEASILREATEAANQQLTQEEIYSCPSLEVPLREIVGTEKSIPSQTERQSEFPLLPSSKLRRQGWKRKLPRPCAMNAEGTEGKSCRSLKCKDPPTESPGSW